jgi:gliding motility-associated-like protein
MLMKKLNLLLILFVSLLINIGFQSQTTFRKSIDVANFDIAGGMVESPLGGFTVAGTNANFIPFFGNVMNMNASGVVQWAKSYTGGVATSFTDIQNVTTGGYIVSGLSSSGGAVLIRLDNLGNVTWAKRYRCPDLGGKPSSEFANAVKETSDGGFIVAGGVDYFWDGVSASTVDTTSALGFKVDAAGTLQWSRVWTVSTTNPDEHYFNDVAETPNGFVFVGESSEGSGTLNDDGDYPRNGLLVKTNTAGVQQYIHRFGQGNTSSQGMNSAIRLSTGHVLIGGYDDIHGYLMRIDGSSATYTHQWGRRINGTGFPPVTYLIQDIMEKTDGTYSFLGTRIAVLTLAFDSYVANINPTTNAISFYKGYAPIGFSAILPEGGLAADQGYYMIMTDQQAGGFNYNVIRTDAVGNIGSAATGCTNTSLTPGTASYTPTAQAVTVNQFTPITESVFTPVVVNLTPTEVVHCLVTVCTPPAAPVGVTATPSTICAGATSSINVSPLVSGVNYNVYTAATGGTNLGAIPQTVSPTTTTTYYVEAVNSADPLCVSTTRTPVNVTVNNAPTATVGSDSPICVGQTLNLTNNTLTGATYSWTGPNGFNSTSENPTIPSATTAATGTYTLIITNNGCPSAPATVNVTVAAPPIASAGSNTPVCVGSPINLTANTVSGATYAWTGPNSFTSSLEDPTIASATTLMAGTYNLAITVGTCSATSSTIVVVNPAPTVTVPSSGQVCVGGTLSLTPSTGGTWSSSNAGIASITNGGVVTGVGAGSANMTFTNSTTGCSSNPTSGTITVNPIPTVTASSNSPVCVGTPINLSGSASSGSYSWTGPNGFISSIQNPTIGASTSAMAGTYSLIITENGCQSTVATTTVVVNTLPTITASATPTTICAGNTINLAGGGGSTYTWTGPNTFASTSQNPTITSATTAASGTYTVTGVAANGCSNTANVLVNVTNGPTVSISPNNIACNGGTTGSAFVNVSGTAPYTYLWTPSGQTGQTASNLTAGSYSVLVSDANGCQSTATTTLTEPSAITLTSSSTPSSCTSPTGSATVNAAGGAGGFTYFWAPSGGTSNTAINIAAGSYTVTVTDANFCQQTATVNVPSVNGPTVVLSGVNNVSCFGGTNGSATAVASLGTPGYTYSWAPTGGTAATATGLTSGSYTVTVVDAAGCSTSETITLTQPNQIVLNETITPTTCGSNTGSINLAVTGGSGVYTYSWTPSTITGSTATNVGGGNYSVNVVDNAGCTASGSFVVPVSGSLNVSLDPTVSNILQGESVPFTTTVVPSNPLYMFTWTPTTSLTCDDCANPTASPMETTTYIVTVTAPDGCVGSDTAIVNVEIVCGEYFLPNIFSPNGDGLNDELCLLGNCITKLNLTIYGRWGEVVFETQDQGFCWDGTFKGQIMNTATFVYVLDLELINGDKIHDKGNLNLVR